MKKMLMLLFLTTAVGAVAAPPKSYEVKSPDGSLSIVLTVDDGLHYSVLRDGAELVAPSQIALTLATGEVLGEHPKVRSAHRRSVEELAVALECSEDDIEARFEQMMQVQPSDN